MMIDRFRPFFKKVNLREFAFAFLASGFGLGLSPIAPGTFGTLSGVAIHLLVGLYLPQGARWYALILIFLIVCAVHFLTAPWAIEHWRSKDPQHFVLDEVAGYLLVPILFPYGSLWQVALWGFLLFRAFDIIKVPPARQIDRNMSGAWGILLDDLVSSGYAVAVMFILRWVGVI